MLEAKAKASDHRRQAKSNGNIFSMPRTNHSGYFGYHNNYAEIKSLSVLRVMSAKCQQCDTRRLCTVRSHVSYKWPLHFYRAMHIVLAWYCYRMSSVRLSVCLSATLMYRVDQFEINITNN